MGTQTLRRVVRRESRPKVSGQSPRPMRPVVSSSARVDCALITIVIIII